MASSNNTALLDSRELPYIYRGIVVDDRDSEERNRYRVHVYGVHRFLTQRLEIATLSPANDYRPLDYDIPELVNTRDGGAAMADPASVDLNMYPWAETCAHMAFKAGENPVYRVGDLVYVQFEGGNPLYPVIIGGMTSPRNTVSVLPSELLGDYATTRRQWIKTDRAGNAFTLSEMPGNEFAGITSGANSIRVSQTDRAVEIFADASVMMRSRSLRQFFNDVSVFAGSFHTTEVGAREDALTGCTFCPSFTAYTVNAKTLYEYDGPQTEDATGCAATYAKFPGSKVVHAKGAYFVNAQAGMYVNGFPVIPCIYLLTPCPADAERAAAMYVRNDLNAHVGKTVKIEGVCYNVARASADGAVCRTAECVDIEGKYENCRECAACWLLAACDEGVDDIVTNVDLSAYNGKIVRLSDKKCYVVSMADDCDGAVTVTVLTSYELESGENPCVRCGYQWSMIPCDACGGTKIIANDLIELLTVAGNAPTPSEVAASGKVFEDDKGRCWRVAEYSAYTEAALTFNIVEVHDSCAECGCWKLTPCAGGAPLYVQAAWSWESETIAIDLNDYLDQIIRVGSEAGSPCYFVERLDTAPTGVTYSCALTIKEAYVKGPEVDECAPCRYYQMKLCESSATAWVYNDLWQGDGVDPNGVVYRGTINGNEGCWEIVANQITNPGTSFRMVITAGPFDNCEKCLETQQFDLTNDCKQTGCEAETADPIVTTDLPLSAVNKWVKVGGICYSVALHTGDPDPAPVTDLDYQGPFETCDKCKAAPLTATKIVLIPTPRVGDDDKSLVFPTEKWIYVNGVLVGVCKGDDVPLPGTDCAEEA